MWKQLLNDCTFLFFAPNSCGLRSKVTEVQTCSSAKKCAVLLYETFYFESK